MNASTIILIIEGIKLIRAIQEGKDLPQDKRVEILSKVVKGNEGEIGLMDKAIQDIKPGLLDFILGLFK